MPLYLTVLVIDLEDDEDSGEAHGCNRVEAEDWRRDTILSHHSVHEFPSTTA